MTFATPCSDGANVYVAFPNNQVACYDLNGKQQWLIWERSAQKRDGPMHTRFCASPFLVGDTLVVSQNGELRAYNKATGKKLWGIWNPYKRGGQQSYRPFPEGCSPVHLRLPYAGQSLDFIADGGGQLYRLTDGAVVCTNLPVTEKGQTPIAVGDLYIWKSGHDRTGYPVGVCRLKAESADKVTCTELWRADAKSKSECTPMFCQGVVYDGRQAWEAVTGKELPTTPMGHSWNSPILAGDYVIGAAGKFVGPFKEKGQVSENVLVDDSDTVDPEWNRKPYCGQAGPFGHGSWYAAGNRVFFRTAGYLWCLGDPKVPFNGTKAKP